MCSSRCTSDTRGPLTPRWRIVIAEAEEAPTRPITTAAEAARLMRWTRFTLMYSQHHGCKIGMSPP